MRSAAYSGAALLTARAALLGTAALGLKVVPGAKPPQEKAEAAFQEHLLRDLLLTCGLLGAGFIIENLESDLNLFLQKQEIDQKLIPQLLQAKDWSDVLGKLLTAYKNYGAAKEPAPVEPTQLDLMKAVAIQSMKRMRFTPLASYHFLELEYGIPLERWHLTKKHEPSFLLDSALRLQACYQQTGCLQTHAERALDSAKRFFKDPKTQLEGAWAAYRTETTERLTQTAPFRLYETVRSFFPSSATAK